MPWCPGAKAWSLAAINWYHGDGKHTIHLDSFYGHLWYLVPIYEHITVVGMVCVYIYIFMIIIFSNIFNIYIYMNGVEHIIHWKSREHSYECVRLCDCFDGCFDSGTWAGIARWWSWGYIRRRLAGLEMVTWFKVWDFSLEELALVFFLFPEPLTIIGPLIMAQHDQIHEHGWFNRSILTKCADKPPENRWLTHINITIHFLLNGFVWK